MPSMFILVTSVLCFHTHGKEMAQAIGLRYQGHNLGGRFMSKRLKLSVFSGVMINPLLCRFFNTQMLKFVQATKCVWQIDFIVYMLIWQ